MSYHTQYPVVAATSAPPPAVHREWVLVLVLALVGAAAWWGGRFDSAASSAVVLPVGDPALAWYAAPTIDAPTYRAALEAAGHPAAQDADGLYTLLVARKVDPAVQLTIALYQWEQTPAVALPAPVGSYNIHNTRIQLCAPRTNLFRAGLCSMEAYPYANYGAALTDYIDTIAATVPAPSLASIVGVYCQEPACNAAQTRSLLTQRLAALRQGS